MTTRSVGPPAKPAAWLEEGHALLAEQRTPPEERHPPSSEGGAWPEEPGVALGLTDAPRIGRRGFLRLALGGGAVLLLPQGCGDAGTAVGPPGSGSPGRFLDTHQYTTLVALVDVLIPEDEAPGAAAAGVADYVDFLLGAFTVRPPRIYAAGPYSGRQGGQARFEVYLPLSRVKEIGWRNHIEGSQGIAEREFNGPVVGLQEIYRTGLATLDELARDRTGSDFRDLGFEQRREIVGDADADFVEAAFGHCVEGMYAAPEYGGNADLAGWRYISYEGDRQPLGYDRRSIEEVDAGSPSKRTPARIARARRAARGRTET